MFNVGWLICCTLWNSVGYSFGHSAEMCYHFTLYLSFMQRHHQELWGTKIVLSFASRTSIKQKCSFSNDWHQKLEDWLKKSNKWHKNWKDWLPCCYQLISHTIFASSTLPIHFVCDYFQSIHYFLSIYLVFVKNLEELSENKRKPSNTKYSSINLRRRPFCVVTNETKLPPALLSRSNPF